MVAEKGFQSGAAEAARLTNVQLSSLLEIQINCADAINAMKLQDLFDLLAWCKDQYWEIPKRTRISVGLRQEYDIGYSGDWVIKIVESLLTLGFRGKFPTRHDPFYSEVGLTLAGQKIPSSIISLTELVEIVEPLLNTLKEKILAVK